MYRMGTFVHCWWECKYDRCSHHGMPCDFWPPSLCVCCSICLECPSFHLYRANLTRSLRLSSKFHTKQSLIPQCGMVSFSFHSTSPMIPTFYSVWWLSLYCLSSRRNLSMKYIPHWYLSFHPQLISTSMSTHLTQDNVEVGGGGDSELSDPEGACNYIEDIPSA